MVGVISARILGPEQRGIYTLFFTTVGLFLNFMGFGFSQANTYYLNKDMPRNKVFGNSVLLMFVQGLILAAIIVIGRYCFKTSLLYNVDMLMLFLLWICAMSVISDFVLSGIVLGCHKYDLYNINMMVQAGTILLVTIPLFFVKMDGTGTIFLRVLAVITVLLWYIINIARKISLGKGQIDVSLLILQIRYGLKNYVQNIVGLLNYKMYLFLLAILMDSSICGVFSVALLYVELLRFIPNAIGTILFPQLTTMSDDEKSGLFTASICRNTIFATIPIMLCIYVLVAPLTHIVFGSGYNSAIKAVHIMLPGALFGTFYQILTRYFSSQNMQQCSIISGTAALFVAGVASYLFIPTMGINGAALAFLICNIILGFTMVMFFKLKTRIKIKDIVVFNKDDFAYATKAIRQSI